MKKLFYMVTCFLVMCSVEASHASGGKSPSANRSAQADTELASITEAKHVPGVIVIRLKDDSATMDAAWSRMAARKEVFDRGKRNANLKAGRATASEHRFPEKFDQLLEKHRIKSMKPAFRVAKLEARKTPQRTPSKALTQKGPKSERTSLFKWYALELPDDMTVEEAVAGFAEGDEVEIAEAVYEWGLFDTIDPPITGLPDATTDPDYDSQWHLASSMIPNGWSYLKDNGIYPGGRSDVVVAVIDSGIDYTHEDLAGNLWINSAEIPDNGIDDDGNGFIDDIYGCNVVSNVHSGDPIDYHGHGTHVSGIIAAQAFNGNGGVGTAFNARIMAVRAAQYSGTLTTQDIAEGILYATDQGAEVINMSFGGYQYSQMVVDALQVALNQAVLVAAAGNDGIARYQCPLYPAHLPWVIGVEAANPDKGRAWFSNSGYEVRAPGVSIYSTLPNDQYAAWSGTSMATPVVSGVAALMRSFFNLREVYSSRFLMGSIVASSYVGGQMSVVDAYRALTEPPKPGVSLFESWLFDDETVDAGNDGDGRIDSGEKVHLGLELINRSGQASDVVAVLRARTQGAAMDDPYVTIIGNEVAYGNIGPFTLSDNGFIYDDEGVITGVETPFVVLVDPNCPNDHIIPFELTTTYKNGWDPEDENIYQQIDRFSYVVQRGQNVPTVISEDTVLTSDEYWMVAGPVLVEEGATLTIEEGTQVQFGSISDDPYNPGPQNGYLLVRGNLVVEGTVSNPVSMFPSYLVSGQTAQITVEDNGQCVMQYVEIRNPYLTRISHIDHGYLHWDAYVSKIDVALMSNSIFHKFPGTTLMTVGKLDTCLFDAGRIVPQNQARYVNCTFLQDNESNNPLSLSVPLSFKDNPTNEKGDLPFWSEPAVFGADTFVLLPMELTSLRLAEAIANHYGGHVASVLTQEESDFLKTWLPSVANFRAYGSGNHDWVYIGLANWNSPETYAWLDGSPPAFTDWAEDYPVQLSPGQEHVVQFLDRYNNGDTNVWGWRNVYQTPSVRTGNGAVSSWKSFLIRIPGTWSLSQLNAPVDNGDLLTFLKSNYYQELSHNAFLSKYWDPDITHWMRIVAPANTANGFCIMRDNYWGTGSVELIDHAIRDYYDNFTSARIVYGDSPTSTFASTYPFVEEVLIGGVPANTVPVIGSGPTTFTVTFNRDMNTNVEPYVTFGPSPPHTDFSVLPRDENYHELDNGWIDARTWEGVFWITPVTGESFHMMRISGAEAADDPWLVSGYDVQRFRFRVQTMGVSAMTLQANGVEGGIELSWLQDDYDLLAGYNLYRADTIDGTYEKINEFPIHKNLLTFLDTDTVPAVPYYYKFTVVMSDFEESGFSNVASAAALDTIPPVITHAAPVTGNPTVALRVSATIEDNVSVVDAFVNYRELGSAESYVSIPMNNVSDTSWSASIPGSSVLPPGIEYYIIASDGITQVFSGTAATPHQVTVENKPAVSAVSPNTGPSGGGTAVSVSGLLFEAGSSVLFGGVPALDVVLINENQLNCTTPPHFPAMVDVTVVNSDSSQHTLLGGFRYTEENIVVSMPADASGDFGSFVEIPISAAGVAGLRAVEITITYDPTVLSAEGGRLGELTAGWGGYVVNTGTPGQVVISMAHSTTVSGSGALVYLTFEVVGDPAATTGLDLSSISLNDGAIAVIPSHGGFVVHAFWEVAGTVAHFNGYAVEQADLSISGTETKSTTTAGDGSYLLSDLLSGNYVLTLEKSGEVNGITAYDASLVLQSAAGLLALSEGEQIAADVNRNGQVTAMDAAYILEHAVGLLESPFPNSGRVWDFLPGNRSFAPLNSDLSGQDFTAILLGDVSGSWEPTVLSGSGGSGFPQGGTSVVIAMHVEPHSASNSTASVLFDASDLEIYSIDLTVSLGSESTLDTLHAGAGVASMAFASNSSDPGIIRCAFAGSHPVNGMGELIEITASGTSSLEILAISINEGAIPVDVQDSTSSFESDSDHDGRSDLDELLAGTNPLDPGSQFSINAMVQELPGQFTISWSAVEGKTYSIEASDSLDSADWTTLAEGIPGTAPETSHTVTIDSERSFFRIKVD
jgi:subtilisin family serine protease